MAMGFSGHNDQLATRYIPLMMEGTSRHWTRGLKPGSVDSWEDRRNAFVTHFAGSCNEVTTIADLDRCI